MVKLKASVAVLLIVACIVAFSGSAKTQTIVQSGSNNSSSNQGVNDQDKEWLRSAVPGSEFEILGGTMAQTHAKYLSTRQFGAVLVIDHMNTFNAENDVLVKDKGGVKVDYRLSGSQNQDLQRLKPLLGRPFDLAYLQIEINDHKKDIADAQKEVREGRSPAVRALAAAEIPLLQKHLAYAQGIYNSLIRGGNGRGIISQSDLDKFFAPEPLPTPTPTPKPTPTPLARR